MRSLLPRFLRGGADELGWDDLVARVVKAIAALARFGVKGRVAFPPDVVVRIEVGEGGLSVIEAFVAKPEFDVEVLAGLANRCDCAPSDLPDREYLVSSASATRVVATEGAPRIWEVRVDGGDLSGAVQALDAGRLEVRFGRGAFHGADQHVRNDLVVCEKAEFVSRRAGRITFAGPKLEVESIDQGDGLVVHRARGEALRPARTARGRVALGADDVIELVDPRGGAIRLVIRRRSIDKE